MTVEQAYAYARTHQGRSMVRTYLDRPRALERDLMLLYARMDTLRERMAPAASAREVYVRTSPGDQTGALACRLADLESEIVQKLHQLTTARAAVVRLLDALPAGEMRDALRLIYAEGMDCLSAAEQLNLHPRTLARRLSKGLELACMHLALGITCADGKKML